MGQFTFVEMWHQMGVLAKIVFLTLIFFSVWSFAVGFERLFFFSKAKKQSKIFAKIVDKYLKQGKLEEILKVARDKKFKDSHVAQVVAAAIEELIKEEDLTPQEKVESAKLAVERATIVTIQRFKRGLTVLSSIAATSPFVGLFGTVFGIINAFQGMAATGSGGIGAVAAGIAEALVTTGTGIGVALPAYWFFNFYVAQIEKFQGEISNVASVVIEYFERKYTEGA